MSKIENVIDLNYIRSEEEIKRLCDTIRQTAYDIHMYFGTGYLEKVYENTLVHRLQGLGIKVFQQVHMVVHDKDGFAVGTYDADLIVEGKIIIELKVAKSLNAAHEAQLMNYLMTTGIRDGLLINFGSDIFEMKKRICGYTEHTPKYIVEFEENKQQ